MLSSGDAGMRAAALCLEVPTTQQHVRPKTTVIRPWAQCYLSTAEGECPGNTDSGVSHSAGDVFCERHTEEVTSELDLGDNSLIMCIHWVCNHLLSTSLVPGSGHKGEQKQIQPCSHFVGRRAIDLTITPTNAKLNLKPGLERSGARFYGR